MVSECFKSLIERPSGISGYRPASWCAVCGRTVSAQTVKPCISQGCPNLSHVECLGEETEYKCGNTGQLRANAGISDPVSPCRQITPSAPPTPSPTDPTEEESDDDLDALQKQELKKVVKNLRRDLTSTQSLLNNYRCVKDYLIGRRRTLVDELSTVDTLLATLTFEEKQQRSVACTARPHNIEAECEAVTRAARARSPPHSQPSRSSSPPPPPPPSPPSPAHPASAQQTSVEETESATTGGDTTDSTAHDESAAERQLSSQQGTQEGRGQRPQPRRKKKPAARGTAPRQEASSTRQQQTRCLQCWRHGHTQDQCPRKPCEYCQGRYHSSQNCRVRIADEKQQELAQAVRQTSQDTISLLRGVAWQLQQPNAQQRVGPLGRPLVPPQGLPAHQYPWQLPPHPAFAFQHGAPQQHFPAMLHAYQ